LVEIWSTPSTLSGCLADFGRDPRRSNRGTAMRFFVFFCQVNNARLYRFPVGQISRNLHTRRGSMLPLILSENICENLPVWGSFFPKRQLLGENLHATSNFRPRFLRNDYKSRRVMTRWHAYGMLAFIYTLGINLKSFPWPVERAHGEHPLPKNTRLRRPYETTSRHAHAAYR